MSTPKLDPDDRFALIVVGIFVGALALLVLIGALVEIFGSRCS